MTIQTITPENSVWNAVYGAGLIKCMIYDADNMVNENDDEYIQYWKLHRLGNGGIIERFGIVCLIVIVSARYSPTKLIF